MKKKLKIRWLGEPETQDYPAAASYLTLLYDKKRVRELIADLKAAPVTQFKAKDIIRASGLSVLGTSNSHVEKDREKLRAGQKLSPVLLARNAALGKVVVADGYHRVCAVYTFDEDAVIPCKIA